MVEAKSPIYIERVEKKYEVGLGESGLPALWRDLSRYIPLHEFTPGQPITLVSSVYFDNKDCDLLRYSLISMYDNIHMRLRTYEYDSQPRGQISDYWVEMKIKKDEVRRKKRFRMKRGTLVEFFEGKEVENRVLDNMPEGADPEMIRSFYREIRDTMLKLGLRPILLVKYKRMAFQNERERERVSLDWDIHHYRVRPIGSRYPSRRAISKRPVGKDRIFLELKYPEGTFPAWFEDFRRRYPLWERRYYSKFDEGMRFLLQGPLKHYKESNYFLEMLEAYKEDWRPALESYG